MPSRIEGSLSIASTVRPASGVAGPRGFLIATTLAGERRGDRHLDPEHRAAAGLGLQRDRVIEHAGDALDDRQAEPEAARDLGALVEALELAEHELLLRGRDAEPGVPDLAG